MKPIKPIKRICLFTATGAENLGDELITLCELEHFLEIPTLEKITLFSHSIDRTKRFLLSQNCPLEKIEIREYFPNNLRTNPLKNISLFWETLKAIKKSDHVFIGGGGLFYAASEEGHSPMRLWWFRAFCIHLLGKPITYLSLGISVPTEKLKNYSQTLFTHSQITVRDHESQKKITEVGFSATILPDPVLSFDWKGQINHKEHEETIESENNKKTIGIALRKGFLADEVILQTIRKLTNQWYQILLLPHSLHPTDEVAHDGYYLQDFLLPWVSTTQTIEQTLAAYQKCHIILAMRLHSMILSVVHHIPFIGISYGQKTNALLEELDWDATFSPENATSESILQSIEDVEKNYSELSATLAHAHQKFQATYANTFTQLLWK